MKLKTWCKIAALALCIAGATVGLTGCGGSGGTSSATKGGNEYIIGTTGTSAKWSENNENTGELQGFDIDVWNEIAKRNGWKIKYQVGDFSGLWGMLDNGQILTIAADTGVNKVRQEKYDFSHVYVYGGYVLMTKPDYPSKDDGIKSFAGKTIAVMANSNMKLALEEQIEKFNIPITIMPVDEQSAVLMAVINGQADAGYVNRATGFIAINSLKMNLKAWDAKYKYMHVAYAFKRVPENKEIREKVSKTVDEMHLDGTLTKLSEKWFGADFSYDPDHPEAKGVSEP